MTRIKIKPVNYWSVNVINPEFLRDVTAGSSYQFPVPTEFVWRQGVEFFPKMSRVWWAAIDLGMRDSADGRSSHREFLALVEIWEDCGDDGHTQYRKIGYATMSGDDAELYVKHMAMPNTYVEVDYG